MADAALVRDGDRHVRLTVSDILHGEAEDHSTHVHRAQQRFTVPRKRKDVLVELPQDPLERVHRGHAVRLGHVKAISDDGPQVRGRWLPGGRSFRAERVKWAKVL